jgi:hypothetical protein
MLRQFRIIEVISAETQNDGVPQYRNAKREKDRYNVNDDDLPKSFTECPKRTQKKGRPVPFSLVLLV